MTTEKTYTMEELNAMHTALVHADMLIKDAIVELSKNSRADLIIDSLKGIQQVKELVWDKLCPLKYPELRGEAA